MMARRVLGWMLVMAVLVAQPVMAQEHGETVDVSGMWDIPLMELTWQLELQVNDHVIGGLLTVEGFGEFPVDRAEAAGDELYVRVAAGGNTFVFEGTVDGDEFAGQLSGVHDQPPMPFKATRRRQ